jgi:hypothetical protein
MPRKRKEAAAATHVTFVGPDKPPRNSPGVSWGVRLQPLVQNPGVWAEVAVFDTPMQAQQAQSNLVKRERVGINIPMSGGVWEFAARDCTLYAIFRGGQKRRGSRSVR